MQFLGAREYTQSSIHLGKRWLLVTKNRYRKLMILVLFWLWTMEASGSVKIFLRHVSAIQWSIYPKYKCLSCFAS